MNQQKPENKVLNQKALLDMLATQAHNKAYEQALGASANFVVAFIRAGVIKNMQDANAFLKDGAERILPGIKADLIAMALSEVNATLPKDETGIPGVDPNVPARA